MSAHALQVWAGWNTFNYRNTHCPEMAVPHRCQNCPHFPSRDKTPQLAPCNAVQGYPKSPITCPSDHPITGLTTKASQRSDYPSLTSAHTPTFKRNEETLGRTSTEGFYLRKQGDLNPRRCDPRWFSRPVHSAALPYFQRQHHNRIPP